MFESLIDTATPWFRDWGLLIVFVATFVESSVVVASVFPGESILLMAGFLSSRSALIDTPDPPLYLPSVIAVAAVGALLGDIAGYVIGRLAGRSIVRKVGRWFFLSERKLPVLERYFVSYGKRAILLGRFAPFLRSVRTLVAGTARMPFARFLVPDVAGAVIWAAAIATTGFVLGESWEVADRYLGAGGGVVFVILALAFFITWRRVRARLDRELAAASAPVGTDASTVIDLVEQPVTDPAGDAGAPQAR